MRNRRTMMMSMMMKYIKRGIWQVLEGACMVV